MAHPVVSHPQVNVHSQGDVGAVVLDAERDAYVLKELLPLLEVEDNGTWWGERPGGLRDSLMSWVPHPATIVITLMAATRCPGIGASDTDCSPCTHSPCTHVKVQLNIRWFSDGFRGTLAIVSDMAGFLDV